MKPSRVLRKLREGKPAFCTKTNLLDPRAIEIMGLINFDCVWLCNEHVPNDLFVLENQIRAAKMHGMDTVVRIAKGSYSDYVRPLEADATGIMVPHVFSAAEAKSIVRTTRFMPLGRRPMDGGNADGEFCLLPVTDYVKTANRERFVIIQIEDPEPLAELDAICSVEGIDMVFFGPGDFSHSIGHAGEIGHPDVVAARRKVVEACRRHGKVAGTVASIDTAQAMVDEGFLFLSIGADVIAIGQYFQNIKNALVKKGLLA